MQWGFVILSEKNNKQIWINSGFAHGFYTLSNTAHVIYKVDNSYNKNSEKTIIWDDPQLSIKWPNNLKKPIISEKDLKGYSINKLTQNGLHIMKVLITGANGQLGKALNKNKLELDKHQDLEIFNTIKSDLDLGDELSCKKLLKNISQIGL